MTKSFLYSGFKALHFAGGIVCDGISNFLQLNRKPNNGYFNFKLGHSWIECYRSTFSGSRFFNLQTPKEIQRTTSHIPSNNFQWAFEKEGSILIA